MIDLLKRFVAAAVALAGIAALYLAAAAIQLTLVFWVVIGGAAVVASAPAIWRFTREAARRIRLYPGLLREYGALVEERDTSKAQLLAAIERADLRFDAGKTEGRAEIRGAALASISEVPSIIAIDDLAGSVCLMAAVNNAQDFQIGARFFVVSIATEKIKGVVEAVEVDSVRSAVILRCVKVDSGPFWEHLASRVSYDNSPPTETELRPYVISVSHPHPIITRKSEGTPEANP